MSPVLLTPPPLLSGLAPIAADYDGYIIDLWGCIHDGVRPFPGVLDALERLMAAGKRICILSNAPRRAGAVAQRITEIGVPATHYHAIMSSGEEAWQFLKTRPDAFYQGLGDRCFHLGGKMDNNMLDGLDLEEVRAVEDASFVLNTGPGTFEDTVPLWEPVLVRMRARELPMICANPDLIVHHAGQMAICGGALAQRYEELGGTVRWHGKPYSSVYRTCMEHLGIADPARVVGIGDSLRTDIAGAKAAGMSSILILAGIHGEEFGMVEGELPDRAHLDAAIERTGKSPTYVMTGLRW